MTGWPIITIARGEVIWRDGKFTGRPGRGAFVARRPFAQDSFFPRSGAGQM